MNCKYLKIRSEKYKKYFYCSQLKQKIELENCHSCEYKEYKTQKQIPNRKKKRTIATGIPSNIKEIVWKRDKHRCILCGKYVPVECACCHFIPRSQGGLGIEQNIFTACNDCHMEQDNGLNSLELTNKVERYLKECYGTNWSKKDLIYKKG